MGQKVKFPPKNGQGCYKAETCNIVNNKEDHSMIQSQLPSRTFPRGLHPFNLRKRGKIPFLHPYFQGNCRSLENILNDIYTLGLINNGFNWKLSASCYLSQFQICKNRFLGGSYDI